MANQISETPAETLTGRVVILLVSVTLFWFAAADSRRGPRRRLHGAVAAAGYGAGNIEVQAAADRGVGAGGAAAGSGAGSELGMIVSALERLGDRIGQLEQAKTSSAPNATPSVVNQDLLGSLRSLPEMRQD